ncbi:MAG: cytochrome c3 family protein [Candidatus Zixiibacteriota bacterium]
MRHPTRFVILLAASLLLLVAVPAVIRAQPKSCYSCHQEKAGEYNRKYRHAPVAKEDCEACHLRHGFANMLVLKKTGKALCTLCHTDFDSTLARSGPVVHPAVTEGLCNTCHNPHASDRPGLLREVDGGLACFVCHENLKDTTGHPVAHAPFGERRCQVCHESHAGTHTGLLKSDVDSLCGSCHPGEKTASAHASRSLVMTGLTCTGCHDPHRSTRPKLVGDRVHQPVGAGQCDACHTATTAGGSIGPADSTWSGCQPCHDDIETKLAKAVPHAPAAGGECYTCHSAHRSSRSELLRGGVAELCQGCHEEMSAQQLAGAPSVHAPVKAGQCQACHDPHGADQPKLLKSAGDQLCLGCHGQDKYVHSSHLESAGLACRDCHAPHTSTQPALLLTDPRSTCSGCHEPELTPMMVSHEPVKQGDCFFCHDPHAGPGHNLRAEIPSLCFGCHQNIAHFVAGPVQHSPAEDCAVCHGAHEAPAANLLLKNQGDLCRDCHTAAPEAGSRSVHAPFASGECSGCHNPHGSDRKGLLGPRRQVEPTPMGAVLRYPKLDSTDVSLCQTCHRDQVQAWRDQPVLHSPVKKGDCRICHAPHESAEANLLLKPAADLCQECHALASLQSNPAHQGINAGTGGCTQCHDPHASGQRGLLRRLKHAPFSEGNCEACHSAAGSATLNEPQPGLCLNCHEETGAQLSLATVHAPAKDGECTSCHGAHTANYEKLLVADAPGLCRQCHQTAKEPNQHPPYVQGMCRSCHAPHGSENARLLVQSPNALCLGCHTAMKERLDKGQRHGALDKGCLACHAGHASAEPMLLCAAPNQLCARCHDLATDKWRAAHPGGRSGDCMSCHDPHAAPVGTAALLKRVEHQPFQARTCNSCHSAGATHKIKGDRALCGKCHAATLAEIDGNPVPHLAMADSAQCMACHSPHVGDTPALLRQSGFAVCLGCHPTVSLTRTHVHPPAKENCATCHTPHGGSNARLLTDDDIMELCLTCHEDASKTHFHPMGGAVKDPRGDPLVCTSCHSPHSSDNTALLLGDPGRELCVRCHDTSAPHGKGEK